MIIFQNGKKDSTVYKTMLSLKEKRGVFGKNYTRSMMLSLGKRDLGRSLLKSPSL